MVRASVLNPIDEEQLVDIKSLSETLTQTLDKPIDTSAAKLNINASEFVPRIQHNALGQAELNLNVLQRHFESTDGINNHEVPIIKSVKAIEQALFQQSFVERQQPWKDFPKGQSTLAEPNISYGETRVMMLNESDYILAPRIKRTKREQRQGRQDDPWDPELKSMYGRRFESEEKRREHERKVAVEALKLVEQRRMRAMEMEAGMFSADGNAKGPIRHIVHTPLDFTPEERERVDQLRIAKKQRIERVLSEMAIHAQKEKERQKVLSIFLKQSQPNDFMTGNVEKIESAKTNTKPTAKGEAVDLCKGHQPKAIQSCADVEKQLTVGQEVKLPLRQFKKSDILDKLQLEQQLEAIKAKSSCKAKYEVNFERIKKYDAPAGEAYRRNVPSAKPSVQFEDEIDNADKENIVRSGLPPSQNDYLRFKTFPKGNLSVKQVKPFGPTNYRQYDFTYGQVNPGFKNCNVNRLQEQMMKPHYVEERNERFGFQCSPRRMYEPRKYQNLSPGMNLTLVPNNSQSQFSPTSSNVDKALKPPPPSPLDDKQKLIFDFARQLLKGDYQSRQLNAVGTNMRPRMWPNTNPSNLTNGSSNTNSDTEISADAANATSGTKTKKTYNINELIKIKEDIARRYAQENIIGAKSQPHSLGGCSPDFSTHDIFSSHSSFNLPWLSLPTEWNRSPHAPRIDPTNSRPMPGLKPICPKVAKSSSKPPENVITTRYTIPELMKLRPAGCLLSSPNIAQGLSKLEFLRNSTEEEADWQ